jgi:hypothetical protein
MQFEKIETGGYWLVEASNDKWFVATKQSIIFSGNFKDTVTYMVTKLGFYLSEVDYGVKELMNNQYLYNHNAIHFGMYKSIIFTCRKE